MQDDFLSDAELRAVGFARLGRWVKVSRHALFYNPGGTSIGEHSRVDAFAIVSAGAGGITIGRYVHISAFATLMGRERIDVGDYSVVSVRASIFSSSEDPSGRTMLGPQVPDGLRAATHAPVIIGRHVGIGSGAVVLPGVTIGESGGVAALSLVRKDVPAAVKVGGRPARHIAERSLEHRRLAEQLEAEAGSDAE